jgi:predicted phosphodiesterase
MAKIVGNTTATPLKVDSELSTTSTNPVQNKVIAKRCEYFERVANDFNTKIYGSDKDTLVNHGDFTAINQDFATGTAEVESMKLRIFGDDGTNVGYFPHTATFADTKVRGIIPQLGEFTGQARADAERALAGVENLEQEIATINETVGELGLSTVHLENRVEKQTVNFGNLDLENKTSEEDVVVADAISSNILAYDENSSMTKLHKIKFADAKAREELEKKVDKGNYTETPYTGGNMLPIVDVVGNTYTAEGLTITVEENGVFAINGTSTNSVSIEITPNGTQYGLAKAGITYKAWFKQLSGSVSVNNGTYLFINGYTGLGTSLPLKNVEKDALKTINLSADTILKRFAINVIKAGITFDNVKCIPYLVLEEEYDETFVGNGKRFNVSNLDKAYEINTVIGDMSPKYFNVETNKVISKVTTSGLESDLTFLTFADSHSFDDKKYRKYNDLMKSGGIDFMVGLGDIMPYETNHTRATAIKGMTRAISVAGRNKNCYYAVGNHDAVFISGTLSTNITLTKKEQHKLMCSHLNGSVHFNELDPYGCYYYTDYEASKVRVIVLNTSDLYDENGNVSGSTVMGSTLMIRQNQLTWFAEKALNFADKTTPTDWSVLVFGHLCSGFNGNPLTKILKACKNGNSLKTSWTDGNVTLSVDVDYSTQGAVNIIGFMYGHAHRDKNALLDEIQCIQFRCDNATLDEVYKASVNGVTAGNYYITTQNGQKHGFTLSSDFPNAKYVMYNDYLSNTYTEAALLDENGVSIAWFSPKVSDYVDTMTEIATGFTAMREEGTATTESCAVVNVNKDTRTITIVPYGVGEQRTINY